MTVTAPQNQHADLAPMVVQLFLGGLPAVRPVPRRRAPAAKPAARELTHGGP